MSYPQINERDNTESDHLQPGVAGKNSAIISPAPSSDGKGVTKVKSFGFFLV
jgi:hypothetical protein